MSVGGGGICLHITNKVSPNKLLVSVKMPYTRKVMKFESSSDEEIGYNN